jgi:hypothetical protein
VTEPSVAGSSTTERISSAGLMRTIDARVRARMHGWRLIAVLALGAALSGMIAARITGADGPWPWNFDSPLATNRLLADMRATRTT